jgi:hypothetical protein
MKIKLNKEKKDYSLFIYYSFIFLLSFLTGYQLKLISSRYLTVGFEDRLLKTAKSDYNFKEVEKKIEEMKKKAEKDAAEAQKNAAVNPDQATGQPGSASAPATPVQTGGSCSSQ